MKTVVAIALCLFGLVSVHSAVGSSVCSCHTANDNANHDSAAAQS